MSLPPASTSTAGLLGVLGAFQFGLAAGAPWGRAAYGGQHTGTLPRTDRRISAVAALGYAGLAVFVASGRGPTLARRRTLTGITVATAAGTVLNGISRSPLERALWTPTCAVLAISAWRARSGVTGASRPQLPSV